MAEYRKLSQEEIDNAANTSLVDFLLSRGEHLEKRGGTFFWISGGNNSVAFIPSKPNIFKHFSTGVSGNAIQFCREYLDMSFQDAVETLNGGRGAIAYSQPPQTRSKAANTVSAASKQPFEPPHKDTSGNGARFVAYLSEKRGISRSVVWDFANVGSLYQTKEKSAKTGGTYSNIAFMYTDFDGKPQGAIKRSLSDKGFKGCHANSNLTDFCFRHDAVASNGQKSTETSRLFVFEAPIDMLSFITLAESKDAAFAPTSDATSDGANISNIKREPAKWKQDTYLALGGVSPSPLLNYISHKTAQGQDIKEIWLALDNDYAGIKACINIINKLRNAGVTCNIQCYLPKGKDWNEDLLNAAKHNDWQTGAWSKDFIDKHISQLVYPGDADTLSKALANAVNKTNTNVGVSASAQAAVQNDHPKQIRPR